MSESDVRWNNGKTPIFITVQSEPSAFGPSPGPVRVDYCIGPGQGIDLSILGLSKFLMLSLGADHEE